jgi:hypothetical protein
MSPSVHFRSMGLITTARERRDVSVWRRVGGDWDSRSGIGCGGERGAFKEDTGALEAGTRSARGTLAITGAVDIFAQLSVQVL